MSAALSPVVLTREDERRLTATGFEHFPALIVRAGDKATYRFLEFFTAQIRNRNTRRAYAEAVRQFFGWCEERGFELAQLNSVIVAAYVEHHPAAAPTVKQHLAALRMLFNWLVIGQILPMNPASSVRGPKHVVKKGKTPVLTAEETRQHPRCDRQRDGGWVARPCAHWAHGIHLCARERGNKDAGGRLLRARQERLGATP